MPHRLPLPNMLRNLLPARGRPADRAAQPDFEDTRPEEPQRATTATASPTERRRAPRPPSTPGRRAANGWTDSTRDLLLGTEIQEAPEDSVADLMDEFFAKPGPRHN